MKIQQRSMLIVKYIWALSSCFWELQTFS